MEIGQDVNTDIVDVIDDIGGQSSNADGGDLQDRIAGDPEDSPWYSSSEGAMVDKNGDVLVDPSTGQPFTSQEEFDKHQQSVQQTARPQTQSIAQDNKQPSPMSRSFSSYLSPDGTVTPDMLFELSKAGADYQYKDELVPNSFEPAATKDQNVQQLDPIHEVQQRKAVLEESLVSPINEIRNWLLSQGADQRLVDEGLAPILSKQAEIVKRNYDAEMENAMRHSVEGKYEKKLTEIEQRDVMMRSNSNIDNLAKKYYPTGGKDQFFSLINGYYKTQGDVNSFERGPSAEVMDLIANVAFEGKKFDSIESRNNAYKDIFVKMTSDPVKAKSLMNIAHYYWLGRNAQTGSKAVFDKGKQSALQQQQRIQRTIKTKPASYSAPSSGGEQSNNMVYKALFGD